MALIGTLAYLAVIVMLFLLAVAFGGRCLRGLRLAPDSHLESALYAAGISIAVLEISVFLLSMLGWLTRGAVFVLLGAMALFAGKGWLWIGELASAARGFLSALRQTPQNLVLAVIIVGFLALDGLMAMAPLTGSDAMNYHFAAPRILIESHFQPVFWFSNSFLTGQGHLLITLGLVLGSDHISLGLIYLGGALTVGTLYLLASRLISTTWALLATLSFVLTPMIYWQIGTSGSPEIWMAFYTVLAALSAARGVQTGQHRYLALAGFFAGAAAGGKYPGWIIPVALAAIVAAETASFRLAIRSMLFSLLAGIYPLLRNALWTGDPLFPFLTAWLTPENFNAYSFTWYSEGMRSGVFQVTPSRVLSYPFLAVLKGDDFGVGHYFGPLVLAFAPLLLLGLKNIPLVRMAGLLWLGVFLVNTFLSQLARYLLPVFPIALVLVFAAMAALAPGAGRLVRVACGATLVVFILFGAGSEALYARNFLPVVLGLEQREHFLNRMAPDYQITAFIDRYLQGRDGKAVIFLRYPYYLRFPFIYSSPIYSWLIDPDRYREPGRLLGIYRRLGARWLVKSPNYPEQYAPALERLERDGCLQPVAAEDLETMGGMRRMEGIRPKIHVVILRISDQSPPCPPRR